VRDHGIAILPDDLPHIFEPFRRGANVDGGSGGLGLGLYITRGILRAHGGDLTIESVPGEGSLFAMTLARWTEGSPT
jgi:signal transduction histidine kinase